MNLKEEDYPNSRSHGERRKVNYCAWLTTYSTTFKDLTPAVSCEVSANVSEWQARNLLRKGPFSPSDSKDLEKSDE